MRLERGVSCPLQASTRERASWSPSLSLTSPPSSSKLSHSDLRCGNDPGWEPQATGDKQMSMLTFFQSVSRATVLIAALVVSFETAHAQSDAEAGKWQTWVLSSGSQFRLPPPPDDAATRIELERLRGMIASRDPAVRDRIAWWGLSRTRLSLESDRAGRVAEGWLECQFSLAATCLAAHYLSRRDGRDLGQQVCAF